MNITRTAKYQNGRMVYDPPFTPEELERDKLRFQTIIESRQAPGAKGTDRAFLQGDVINHGLGDHPRWMAETMIGLAKKAGVNVTGKVYKGGLADGRGPSDPRAWVSDTHDVLSVARDRNLNVTGGVEHSGQPMPPPADVPLSDKMVRKISNYYLGKDPELKRKPKQEIREMVIDRHGAPAKGRGKPSKIG